MANHRDAQIAADEAFARSLQEAEFAGTSFPAPTPERFFSSLSSSSQGRSRPGTSRHGQNNPRPRPHWSDFADDEQGFSHHHEHHTSFGDSSFHFESRYHTNAPGPGTENRDAPPPGVGHLPPMSAFMPGAARQRQGVANAGGNFQNRNDGPRRANHLYTPNGPHGSPGYMRGRDPRGQLQRDRDHLRPPRSARDRVNTPRDSDAERRAQSAMRRLGEGPGDFQRHTDNPRAPGESYGAGASAYQRSGLPRSEQRNEQRNEQRGEMRGGARAQDPFGPHSLFGHVFGPHPRAPTGMGSMEDEVNNVFRSMLGEFPGENPRTGRQGPSSEGAHAQGPGGRTAENPPDVFDVFDGVFNMFGRMGPGRDGMPFGSDGPGTSAGRPGPGRGSPLEPMLSLFRSAGLFDGDGRAPRTYEEWLQFGENLGAVNRGATDEEIANLPTETVGRRPSRSERQKRDHSASAPGSSSSTPAASPSPVDEEEKCAICLGEFEEGTVIKKLPCGHIFCDECISRWLHINKECPCCKASIRDSDG